MRNLLIILIAALLTSCALFRNNANVNGALPIVPSFDSMARVDLPSVLLGFDPQTVFNARSSNVPNSADDLEYLRKICGRSGMYNDSSSQGTQENQDDRRCLVVALYIFEEIHSKKNDLADARNRVQEQLISASMLACTQFKQHLNSFQANSNFILGSIATGLAGAGAITTHERTARTLAGTSSIFGGIRAELNADYFYQNAATVITKAIDNLRKDYLHDLRNIKQKKTYGEYQVEAAISDAYEFNDLCSLVKGFEGANVALTMIENPGLRFVSKTLADANIKPTTGGLLLQLGSVPSAPLKVEAQRTENAQELLVSITPPMDAGDSRITSYEVSVFPRGGEDVDAKDLLKLSHLFKKLKSDTVYTFTVTATNMSGRGPASAPTTPLSPK